MKTFSSMAAGDQAGPSNRRQPVRQTRTNPTRTSTITQIVTSSNLLPPEAGDAQDPGFFPAITHFTNSIAALPKEMIRHYTMLKEVDAKIYGPEAELGQLVSQALKYTPPKWPVSSTSQGKVHPMASTYFSDTQSRILMTPSPHDTPPSVAPTIPGSAEHRFLFQNIRNVMSATLAILDEKNHVMNTAMETLARQLRRCESSYPHIENEISEEARYGSLTHWAYTDKASEKKSILVGERTRRSQNIQDAKEAEGAAIRSDLRRDAIKSSKARNQHIDSDIDDNRGVGKKGQTGAKGRRIVDSCSGTNGVGLGIANAAAPPNKRRKIEKGTIGGVMMIERSIASEYGSSTSAARAREPSAVDSKKKPRMPVAANGNPRRRGNNNTSGISSPLVSSPVMGTFATAGSKDRQGRSPAPGMQRMPSARARQNSNQNAMTLARNRSSSAAHKIANGGNAINIFSGPVDVDKVSIVPGFLSADQKNTMKDSVKAKGEHLIEDVVGSDGPADVRGDGRGGLVVPNRNNSDRNPKREEQADTSNIRGRVDRPAPVSTRGSGGGGIKAPSANPTPRDANFGERARQPRGTVEQPQKRSHKKGAGLAAQLAAKAAQQDDEGSSAMSNEDDEDGENEPRYCYCNQVSYGEMVGCDAEDCSREWFHLQCVGLTKAPSKNAKWFCEECKENLKKGKFNGGNGR